MRDHNDKFEQANTMLGEIHRLVGGGSDESPLEAAQRFVAHLDAAYEAIKRNVAKASQALGASAWMIDGSDLAERCEHEVLARRAAENRAASAEGAIDLQRGEIERLRVGLDKAEQQCHDQSLAYKTLREIHYQVTAELEAERKSNGDVRAQRDRIKVLEREALQLRSRITHLTTQLKNAEQDRRNADHRERVLGHAIIETTIERLEEREKHGLDRQVMAGIVASAARDVEELKEQRNKAEDDLATYRLRQQDKPVGSATVKAD